MTRTARTAPARWPNTAIFYFACFLIGFGVGIPVFAAENIKINASEKERLVRQHSQLLEQFADMRELLQAAQSMPLECYENEVRDIKSDCRFADLCNVLNNNRENQFAYRNKNGRGFANQTLYRAEKMLATCYENKVAEFDRKTRDKLQNIGRIVEQARLRKGIDLEKVAQKHGQLNQLSQVRIRVLDELSRTTNTDEFKNPALYTPQEVKQRVESLTAGLNPPMHPELKKAFHDEMYAQTAMFNMVMQENLTKPSSEWQPVFADPYYDFAYLSNVKKGGGRDRVLQRQKSMQKRLNHTHKLFLETQKKIEKVLQRRKKRNPTQAKHIDSMIERIKTVAMEPVDYANAGEQRICAGPNAFYDGERHVFKLCHQLLNMPDAAVISVIAHEIGHSIDPCLVASPLVQYSGELKQARRNSTVDKQLSDWGEAKGYLRVRLELPKRREKYYVNYMEYAEKQMAEQMNGYKTERSIAAVPLAENPFSSVISCLRHPGSLGARMRTIDADARALDKIIEDTIKRAGGRENAEKTDRYKALIKSRQNMQKLYDQYGACPQPGNPQKAQMQEAFSDWIMGEVLGDLVKETDPKEKRRVAFESSAFWLASGCLTSISQREREVLGALKKMKCIRPQDSNIETFMNILRAHAYINDSHSFDTARVNKIIMTVPGIRESLGCKKLNARRNVYCH